MTICIDWTGELIIDVAEASSGKPLPQLMVAQRLYVAKIRHQLGETIGRSQAEAVGLLIIANFTGEPVDIKGVG